MKLLFIILAHSQPSQAADLAKVLVHAAGEGTALIHFDLGAAEADFRLLQDSVAGNNKIHLVRDRVRCKWGDYSLVHAVISSLKEMMEKNFVFDYALLLSASCLPNRSVKKLERYLEENYGREFIETSDPAWVVDGLRSERFELYYPFSADPGSYWEHLWTQSQKLLGIKRQIPRNLSPKFGSQWWALTWKTCTAVVKYLLGNKEVSNFFRNTYIPDEIVFPTIVNAVCDREDIAGFNLTTYLFTDKGKPAVFFDDHIQMAARLNKFFFRKVSPGATKMREEFLATASLPDDGEDLSRIGLPNPEYKMKITAQTHFPRPGQIFYRDNYLDYPAGILKNIKTPYIVVFGQDTRVAEILSHIDCASISSQGRLFSPLGDRSCDWGSRLGALQSTSPAVRDIHPALFLARVRTRLDRVVAFGWAPGDNLEICEVVASDPNALCILSLQNDEDLFGEGGVFGSMMVREAPPEQATKAFEIVTGATSSIPEERYIVDHRRDNRRVRSVSNEQQIRSKFSHLDWFTLIVRALGSEHVVDVDRNSVELKQ
jgi:hypothetical protein